MKVFISYSKKNPEQVKTLQDDLQVMLKSMFPKDSHEIWFDRSLHVGHDWWASICEEIRNCDLFIFALSTDSLQSSACQQEWGYAAELRKRILPVWIAGETTTPNDLAEPLRRIQYIDYRKRDIPSYQQLQDGLAHLPNPVDPPNPLPPEPPVPTSPLIEIAQQLQSKLSEGDQWVIYGKLKTHLSKPDDAKEARRLLMLLGGHDELVYALGVEINRTLTPTAPIPTRQPPPQTVTSRPADPQPQPQKPPMPEVVSTEPAKGKKGCSITTIAIIVGAVFGLLLGGSAQSCGYDVYGYLRCESSFSAALFIVTFIFFAGVGFIVDKIWGATRGMIRKS